MARYVFRLPDIGEGIAEAEVVTWHVAVGDRIEEDGLLAGVMTDKATVDIESPVSGVVLEIAGEAGDKVAIGAPLVVIEVEGSDAEVIEEEQARSPKIARNELAELAVTSGAASGGSGVLLQVAARGSVLASPAVRNRARSLGIHLGTVPVKSGEIVRHEDIDAVLTARERSVVHTPAAKPPLELLEGAGEQIKVIGLRRRIAENMAASKRHIPHFSYVEEVDVTALEALRGELNALQANRPKLTLLPFIIAAICRCLPEFPMINARYDDEAGVITRYTAVHIGVAAQTPAGLMVPVIRNAQALGLWQLAGEIARLAEASRDGTAKTEDLSGSTLTVTSLGTLGGIATTPVINRPEVAIIGPNRITERAVFVSDGADGERIEKRKMMNVSISCDHRVVDGWDGASFVQALKGVLEAPLITLSV